MSISNEIYAKKSKKFIKINNYSNLVMHLKKSTYIKFKDFSKGITSKKLIEIANAIKEDRLKDQGHPFGGRVADKFIKFAKKYPDDKFILVCEGSPTVPFPRRDFKDAKEEYKEKISNKKSGKNLTRALKVTNSNFSIYWIIFAIVLILLFLRFIL